MAHNQQTGKYEMRTCCDCGKAFSARAAYGAARCAECARVRKLEQMRRAQHEHHRWELEVRQCKKCGKEFKPQYSNQVCCSAECQRRRNKVKTYLGAKEAKARLKAKARHHKEAMLARLAARDAEYERTNRPRETVVVQGGLRVVTRGTIAGSVRRSSCS